MYSCILYLFFWGGGVTISLGVFNSSMLADSECRYRLRGLRYVLIRYEMYILCNFIRHGIVYRFTDECINTLLKSL